MTTIVLTNQAWKNLKRRVIKEYGDGIFLISWRLQRELGFSVRRHVFFNQNNEQVTDTRLDFDDPAQATFFQLKYL
jgi:hypothetical protein